MASTIKLIAQARSNGASKTFDYKPGDRHSAEANYFYKILVDGKEELPPDTKIVRHGNALEFDFADGTKFELTDWCGVSDSRLMDLGNTQAYSNGDSAYLPAKEIESGSCVIWGEAGQAGAILGDGGGIGPAPTPTAGAAGAGGDDHHTGAAVIGAVLALGGVAALAHSGGGGGGGGSNDVNDAPVNSLTVAQLPITSSLATVDKFNNNLILSVSDPDEATGPNNFKIGIVDLLADDGTLSIVAKGAAQVQTDAGAQHVIITGNQTDINLTLDSLVWNNTPFSTTTRDVHITMTSTDLGGTKDIDIATLHLSSAVGS